MHDLRKQALLESRKTVSRKARSKLGTPSGSRGNSVATSPRSSRVGSRNVSDDESEFSDTTDWSMSNSIDELLSPVDFDPDAAPEVWIADLEERITALCDRKRSSVQGREERLVGFNALLTRHYAADQVKPKLDELVPALMKSVKGGQTERETVLALKALSLVLVTEPSETIYDALADPTKAMAVDAEHAIAKIAAIHALGVITFYGGASSEETQSVMDFLLEIASSDGASVEEPDNAEIVVAALEEWGFLATQMDDLEEATEEAMETFVDQLDSSDVGVQIAAGENIALLFEKSYTEAESDEEDNHASGSENDDDDQAKGPRMIKRYTVYRQTHQLKSTLERLAKASSRRISKKARKNLHLTFSDILHTVEKPTRGPRYSTALDDQGRELGSRIKIAVPGGGRMTVDKWWKLHRLNGLKRLLQGGFLVHYEFNQTVFDTLPVIVEDDDAEP